MCNVKKYTDITGSVNWPQITKLFCISKLFLFLLHSSYDLTFHSPSNPRILPLIK